MVKLAIDPAKIGMIIGPGGKTINRIQDDTDTKLEIDEKEDSAFVVISGRDPEGIAKAEKIIRAMTTDPKVGDIFASKVVGIKEFGAFCEIAPGRDGLVHISELDHGYVKNVDDVIKIGDEFDVKVIAIDDQGRIKLSRKALLPEPTEKPEERPSGGERRRQSGGSNRER
jgi:polyribonucleotide nucleotidyltransferase